MADEFVNVIDDESDYEQQGQYLPLELPATSKSSLNRISEEFNFALPNSSVKSRMLVEEARYTYPTQLTNSFDRENWTISTDHCYARPRNWRQEGSFLRPTKTLFIQKLVPTKYVLNESAHIQEKKGIIDVESEVEVPAPNYDVSKAKHLMQECEKHAFAARADTEEDWEEKVSKINWSPSQHKIFIAMVKILDRFNLSKLAHSGSKNEPLLRRTIIDKAVERVRRLFATQFLWDFKLLQWLHQLFIEQLGPHYLACYLDILQTLKAKLPSFIEKMMHGTSSSVRMGSLNVSNLTHLLEKPWDPVSTTLMQDKPKKLPGNPILVMVPSGPTTSKLVDKWLKLLTNLATVVTISTNFGSSGHRMTMPTILDQLFSVTRGKIHDIRAEFPSRNIILVGFNSGAALAMQVAQVEPVLCVISVGFSLKTAEGPRGEPDDNILELQCPVFFIIGQSANNTSQEDLEAMRERMRVETGLLVVGTADEYLRINKKKMAKEGITQSIADRCVVDEIGEFVSGLILSPYPPQIRQSPAHVAPDTPIKKKGTAERKRYNSNASSLDSEPPSPTPVKMNRPGRPPGSKAKNRLESKWAQQIAQGNLPPKPSVSSPSTPPPYPSISTPDTSSTDSSSLAEKPLQAQPQPPSSSVTPNQPDPPPVPIKKIKTLKPVVSAENKTTPSPVKNQPPMPAKCVPLPTKIQSKIHTPQSARAHAFGRVKHFPGNTSVTNLLQGGIKTIAPTPPTFPKQSSSGIRVLENVTLNSTSTGQLLPNRTIDLSKLTFANSARAPSTSVGNVLLLPDGKIKTVGSSVKGIGNSPILLPLTSRTTTTPKPSPIAQAQKIITGKRQLMNQKPPKPVKKPFYMPLTNVEPTLPPPTNLTTQDIMDLPIIFADDNQILNAPSSSANTPQATTTTATTTTTTTMAKATNPTNLIQQFQKPAQTVTGPAKFMLVNKQAMGSANLIISPNIKQGSPVFSKPTPKYTKIILSSKKNNLDGLKTLPSISKTQGLSPEITIKKVPSSQGQIFLPQRYPSTSTAELLDLDNEIKATAVPKPNMNLANLKLIPKPPTENILSLRVEKRTPEKKEGTDPDYLPPKNMRME